MKQHQIIVFPSTFPLWLVILSEIPFPDLHQEEIKWKLNFRDSCLPVLFMQLIIIIIRNRNSLWCCAKYAEGRSEEEIPLYIFICTIHITMLILIMCKKITEIIKGKRKKNIATSPFRQHHTTQPSTNMTTNQTHKTAKWIF